MPKKVIKWSCSYCKNFVQTKIESVLKHESRCFYNPKNKACLTCANFKRHMLTKDEKKVYVGYKSVCIKLGIIHYSLPPKADVRKTQINLDTKTSELIGEYKNYGFHPFMEQINTLKIPTSNCKYHKRKLK
jgi:hypothetical protein